MSQFVAHHSGRANLLILLVLGSFWPAGVYASIDYNTDVKPIFAAKCVSCHGALQQASGLRLDDRESALKGGNSGVVIQPNDPAGSKLMRRVRGDSGVMRMPPSGPKLSSDELQILDRWIAAGAPWPRGESAVPVQRPSSTHWSFQPVRRPSVPQVNGRGWVRNPIDAFILHKLEAQGIAPSPEADSKTLRRRLHLDLVGLPPPQGQSEQVYEAQVEQLFASPQYGEKWSRHWLDLARYADSDGYEKDFVRPYAWRYRNWVIQAFNRDMPFDEFTIQQIAGDLLPEATVEQKVATGFHRNTLTNREGGVDPEQFRFEQVVDRTNTIGTVWLGLTVNCAQCHDHKYDPISHKDYYSLFAHLNSGEEALIDAPLPGETEPYLQALPEYERKRAKLLAEYGVPELQHEWEKGLLSAVEQPGTFPQWDYAYSIFRVMIDEGEKILRIPPHQRTRRQQKALTTGFITNHSDMLGKKRDKEVRFAELRDKLKELDATLPPFSQAPVVVESANPPKTHIHLRGEWRDKGIEVQPATLSVLPQGTPGAAAPNRLTLARWLVSGDNPLTARVTVNRIWQELFGQGLVRTSEDFGTQGEQPSHPELLDWLAAEFMDHGWSFRHITRLIVNSSTYRQSSAARAELAAKDPTNALLARQARLRLPAEAIRDSALSVSGLLNPAIGGPSVRPPQPAGVAELGYANSVKWEESKGADRYRRGLYVHFQRTVPYPMLANFDAPDSNITCSRRRRSNTPLQALNLLNDPVFFEAAQSLAKRIEAHSPADAAEQIRFAFRAALARDPSPTESAAVVEALKDQGWLGVSRVLLNLDEFITRE